MQQHMDAFIQLSWGKVSTCVELVTLGLRTSIVNLHGRVPRSNHNKAGNVICVHVLMICAGFQWESRSEQFVPQRSTKVIVPL